MEYDWIMRKCKSSTVKESLMEERKGRIRRQQKGVGSSNRAESINYS